MTSLICVCIYMRYIIKFLTCAVHIMNLHATSQLLTVKFYKLLFVLTEVSLKINNVQDIKKNLKLSIKTIKTMCAAHVKYKHLILK